MNRKRWIMLAVGLGVILVAAVGVTLSRGRGKPVGYRTEPVQRGDVRVQVTATGTLNPVTTVQVGSQVSGTIAALYADFNSPVKRDQILAQLDPTFLRTQAAQNEADVERAQVALRQAERDLSRQQPLRDQGLASQAEIDAAETAVESARASVKSAQAALERAQTNLHYATIRSPIDGVVISRNVDVGQTVAASLSAPTLFTIANDLTRMQLEAWVDEADIGRIRIDQSVTFTVDAFPDETFTGHVQQVRLAPRTEQNVISYTVIVSVANPDQHLLPGMTANATFFVEEARDALKVPSAALRFHPFGPIGERRMTEPGGAEQRPGGPRPGSAPASGVPQPSAEGPGARAGWGGPSAGRASVYVLKANGELRHLRVDAGLSDGIYTAVASDSLQEGMQVVVGADGGLGQGPGTVNPFMPGGGRRDRH